MSGLPGGRKSYWSFVYWVYLNMEVRGTVLCGEFPWWTKFLDFKLMLLLSSMFFVVIMTWPAKMKRQKNDFCFSSCCRHPSLLLQSADVLDVRPGHDQPDRRRPELQLGPEDAAVEDVQRNVRSGWIIEDVFVHFLVWLKCNLLGTRTVKSGLTWIWSHAMTARPKPYFKPFQ